MGSTSMTSTQRSASMDQVVPQASKGEDELSQHSGANRPNMEIGDNGKVELATPPLEENLAPRYSSYTQWQKRIIVLSAAMTAFFSPLTAQIYLPALPTLSKDLGVSSSKINLTITTYMIFQGITPMFIGSLADSGGRRPAYIICFVVYIAANIGLAVAPNYNAVLGLRCIQSAGSSSTVALCTAVVADVVTSAERGQYIGFTVVPAVLAPALGPVIGGLLSQKLGWRSIFWFLVISSGVAIVLVVVFFPETCRPIVGDGSRMPPPMYRSVYQMLKHRHQASKDELTRTASTRSDHKFKFKPPNILGSLFMLFEKETGVLLMSSSVVFAGFYCIATAMPTLISSHYGYDEIEVGLMYLPLAGGSVLAAMIIGPLMNWNFKRYCSLHNVPYDRSRQQDLSNFPLERARLEIGFPLLGIAGVTIIAWGWAIQATAHIAVICLLNLVFGVCMIGYNNTNNVLLVDLHSGKAGTATAANNLTRCLVGAGATAAIVPLMDKIGVGWAFTLIGGVYFLSAFPLLLLLLRGMKWRHELQQKNDRKAHDKSNAT